jgi:hypothetical protein
MGKAVDFGAILTAFPMIVPGPRPAARGWAAGPPAAYEPTTS